MDLFRAHTKPNAFTLIELVVVLALIALSLGLVIIRLPAWGPRQKAIASARRIGALIERYRGLAAIEGSLYALRLESDSGQWALLRPAERNLEAARAAVPLRTGKFDEGVALSFQESHGRPLASPLTLFLGPRGILPNLIMAFRAPGGPEVLLRTDPLLNEVAYDER